MNEPRIYRHPPVQYVLLLLAMLMLGGGLFFMITLGEDPWGAIFVGIMFLFILVYGIFAIGGSVIITDAEITTKNILGEKALAWSEIRQVGGGSGLKLKNMDGNMTVSIPSELPGFEEIVEIVGAKRPDLFAAHEFAEIDSGMRFFLPLGLLGILAGGALVVLVYLFRDFTDVPAAFLMPMIILAVLGLFILGTALSTPRAITLDGHTLSIKYLWREKTPVCRRDCIGGIEIPKHAQWARLPSRLEPEKRQKRACFGPAGGGGCHVFGTKGMAQKANDRQFLCIIGID